MTDKTAIEKALRALYGWIKAEVEHFGATCPDDFIIEMVENALAAIEAEKPAEDNDAYDVALRILSLGNSEATPANISDKIESFAAVYHAEQCKACDWNKNCDNCGWTETRTGYGCQNHEVTECLPGKRKGWKQNV